MRARKQALGLVLSHHAYRTLLHAFPGEFRRSYGRDAEEAFRDLYRAEYTKGGLGTVDRARRQWDLPDRAAVRENMAQKGQLALAFTA